jgi:protein SCO1/2
MPTRGVASLRALALGACLVGLGVPVAAAHEVNPSGALDPAQAIRLSQAALGRQLGEYRFTDQFGKPLALTQLRGRPLVISFVYTSCAFVCPTLTSRLNDVVKMARSTLGRDSFSVLTVGFDTRVDGPEQMRRFAAERGVSAAGWYFAAADQATVDRLANDTGFIYVANAGGFDHLSQVTIVDAGGRVYRQVYGAEFEPPAIVDPLKSLALGAVSGAHPLAELVTRVRLLCTAYDPKSGRYRFDYSLILEIVIGVMCTLAVAVFVIRAWREPRHVSADPGTR